MKRLQDLKIKLKILYGFLIMAVFAVIVGLVGMFNIYSIKNEDQQLYKHDSLRLQYSGEAAVNFTQLRYYVLKLITDKTQAAIDESTQMIGQYKTSTEEHFNQFSANIKADASVNAEVAALNDSIMANWESYKLSLDNVITAVANKDTGAIDSTRAELVSIGGQLRDDILSLMALVAQEAESKAAGNAGKAMTALIIMIAVIVVAVAAAIILETVISKSLADPMVYLAKVADLMSVGDMNLEKVTTEKDSQLKYRKDEVGRLASACARLVTGAKEQIEAAKQVAGGDLTSVFKMRSDNDELGMALGNLVTNLNVIVKSIISASDQVASGANSLSDSSMALSQGATEQASSVEELTASLEQVAAQTGINAQNAEMANELATKAKVNASSGNSQMQEMLKAMDDINVSSANINKIIKVIDDIAFQTNILALNAAVEAARAGQHGLGFAVVAEEVRTLAAKSASAANETTEMIENSIRKVEIGTKIASETANALGRIVTDVEKAASLVSSIAVASKEQAAAIEQINQGVMQISQVVQTNAATSEESAAASQELSGQAAQLKEIVNSFKIARDSASGSQTGTRARSSYKAPVSAPAPAAKAAAVGSGAKKPDSPAPSAKPRISLGDNDFGKY
jgi:methyl-accepting chemotaxis protein